ncbi:amidohydrolase [Microbacterium sp. gxy059]|uniref:amidohydrolase n=1 Tax=Microbacterium sp. gxy059 TaxID=2957199 RepID=UPI003D98232D
MNDALIANVRPWGGEPVDVTVRAGTIAQVEPAGAEAPGKDPTGLFPASAGSGQAPGSTVDGAGRLAFPAFSDVHVHLDSTRVGLPFRPNDVVRKSLWSFIQNDRDHWREAEASVSERASLTLGRAVAHGMTRARSYAQIDADCGLERLEGVLAAREEHRDRAQVEVVAFPQAGLLLEPGVPALIEEGLRSGVDLVGGIDPCALDADPRQHLDTVFDMAERHGARIDIHLHEPGELGLFSARQVIKRVRALDLRGRVTLAHSFFLAGITESQRADVLADMAELDIALTTVAPGDRGVLPMLEIMDAGVRLGLGQDGQRDYWSPYGSTDMLDRTWQLAFTNNLRRDEDIERAFETATLGGARVMDASASFGPARGFDVGDPADFVLVPGELPAQVVMDRPGGRTVVHGGRVVAEDGTLL